eukprot:SAG25_NODE_101_length_15508_cov_11.653384_4_plen_58_part_00
MHHATDCAVCTIRSISLLGLVRLVSGLSLLFSPHACRFRGRMVLGIKSFILVTPGHF